jgi:WD40 repeat protein
MENSVHQNGYITKHSGFVCAVAFHPEDKDLDVSAGQDGKIKLVSKATGTVRRIWSPNHDQALSVCFSPDGESIAAGFSDGALMILDSQGGEEECTLTGHTYGVTSVAFSPDGKHVASGSHDNTVRIWDVATGKEAMAPLRGDKSSWVGVPAELSGLAQRVKDGTTDKSRSLAFVVTAQGDHVFVYSLLDDHHKLDGDNTKEAVAQYRAPADIYSISCMGKCVCVGLADGQVCNLYLNVQKEFTCAMKPVCME